jgi:diguanylate cyclase (GGDEF)-like protein/PAS domain S-box-containing protein
LVDPQSTVAPQQPVSGALPGFDVPLEAGVPERIDQRLVELNSLLARLEQSPPHLPLGGAVGDPVENRLVQARLGMASSLYLALRSKHAPTAGHSLRVALASSAWATALQVPNAERDAIEVAALLHDIGKIGVPDKVLLKPGPLTGEEMVLMEHYRQLTIEILTACCASPLVLNIVRHVNAWYDGSRSQGGPVRDQIPLGSRLIAIMDAFDAMTCSEVYRPPLTHERAVHELFSCAGTQFDPRMVRCFNELQEHDLARLHRRMAAQWLQELDPASSDNVWQHNSDPVARATADTEVLFQRKLLDNMYDAVVFLDNDLRIQLWNRGAERLTGVSASGVLQHHFRPSMLEMRDEESRLYSEAECPVAHAFRTGVQSRLRLITRGRSGRNVAIDAHIIPVAAADGTLHGVTLLLHDASPEASLEARCHRLQEKAIRDPLTQVANRAEFDRVQSTFIEAHDQRGLSCSLIICDIDRFKLVNDTYGHPAGDEVIRSFAQVLKSYCRSGDLVARYGGEEFVMLCADCNLGTAFERAEQVRRAFAALPQAALGGKPVTASFGVTETQPGDTSETLLNRADRALLQAKEAGRNIVVQVGVGQSGAKPELRRRWWQLWRKALPHAVLEQKLLTTVPLKVAIEKLRGFVADHHANVESIDDSRICMSLDGGQLALLRRTSDRNVPLVIDLSFAEEQMRGANAANNSGGTLTRTKIQVSIRPRRGRDRRRAPAVNRARVVLASLRSYLMATDDLGLPNDIVLRRSTHMAVASALKK